MDSIEEKLAHLKNDIGLAANKSNRTAQDIRVIYVTKHAEINDIISAVKCGCYEIGENRQQELSKKYNILKNSLTHDEFKRIKWHFIGHLQTNKIKSVLPIISMIQSVDSLHLASAINAKAAEIQKEINILLQIKISPEKTKSGFAISQIAQIFEELAQYPQLKIQGLMGLGIYSKDSEDTRVGFRNLKMAFEQANNLLASWKYPKMEILSMGMSNDFKVAIEEGSNMIRVGSAIFGG